LPQPAFADRQLDRIYLAIITPFHRLIVARMLADLGHGMRAVSSPPSL
jgi:hypothetical protein